MTHQTRQNKHTKNTIFSTISNHRRPFQTPTFRTTTELIIYHKKPHTTDHNCPQFPSKANVFSGKTDQSEHIHPFSFYFYTVDERFIVLSMVALSTRDCVQSWVEKALVEDTFTFSWKNAFSETLSAPLSVARGNNAD